MVTLGLYLIFTDGLKTMVVSMFEAVDIQTVCLHTL